MRKREAKERRSRRRGGDGTESEKEKKMVFVGTVMLTQEKEGKKGRHFFFPSKSVVCCQK